MPAPRKPSELDRHEQEVHDTATQWSAVVVIGREKARAEAPSKDEAIAAGRLLAKQSGRKAMVYAIGPGGAAIMVGLVNSAGEFASAILDR